MPTQPDAVLTDLGSRDRRSTLEVKAQANTALNITKARTPTDPAPPASPSPIPAPGPDLWIKLVCLAREFGITERALTALWQDAQERRSA